ncbi:MAG: ATP-dependent helicase [Bacteroidota bacterium]
MKDKIKNDLNPVQQKAVLSTEGPSLVIAGAGSGKTRVLTYRIAYLIHKGVKPYQILALTFTNKAAREMKERIQEMVGESNAASIWMGTFHSIFARILRKEAPRLGFTQQYTIFDQTDSRNLIKKIITDMKLDVKQYPPKEVQNRISSAKNNLMTFQAYKKNTALIAEDRKSQRGEFVNIYERYAKSCKKNNVMDFDDLLLFTNILFKKHPDVLAAYQDKFRYILVDEYQDTNYAQYLILKNLARARKNLCVVGDDSQSIYAFRGAKIENIFNFKKDYLEYTEVKLEQNYRSTQSIVEAANSLIAKNQNKLDKKIFSKNQEGILINVFGAATDTEEAFYITDDIKKTQEETKKKFDEFAILYRTNAQSRQLEEALRKKDVPYMIYAGLSFYQRKEIKDIIAYFRLIVNPKDDEALKRIINYPSRKIGKTSVDRIEQKAEAVGENMWDVIRNIQQSDIPLNAPTKQRIAKFAALIQDLQKDADELDAFSMGDKIIKTTGILAELKADKSPEGISRIENVDELLSGIQDYIDQQKHDDPNAFIRLTEYLENVSLLTTQDTAPDDNEPKVNLMTIHAAKGLEFDVVYIAGAEEDLFPGKMSTFSRHDLEEERRLFYVAMTRAREKLVITHANSRYRFGSLSINEPSRFIKDIDPRFLTLEGSLEDTGSDPFDTMFDDEPGLSQARASYPPKVKSTKYPSREKKKAKPGQTQNVGLTVNPKKFKKLKPEDSAASSATNSSKLIEGQRVSHERFGRGIVRSIEGAGADQKAIVDFDKHGEKKLLLKFARLKILS